MASKPSKVGAGTVPVRTIFIAPLESQSGSMYTHPIRVCKWNLNKSVCWRIPMSRILGMVLILAGVSVAAFADGAGGAPEISAGSAISALALLSGGLLVYRGRRR